MTLKKTIFGILFFALTLFLSSPSRAYDPDYLTDVVGKTAVQVSDGYELIMILMQIEDRYPDFASRQEFLRKTNLIKEKWSLRSQTDPLRRGELSYMLVKMLRLNGGLKARLLGMNERFALEELISQGIMREGHPLDLVTGQELVLVMTRAAEFMRARSG